MRRAGRTAGDLVGVALFAVIATAVVQQIPGCGMNDIWCYYESWVTHPVRLTRLDLVGDAQPTLPPPERLVLQSDEGPVLCPPAAALGRVHSWSVIAILSASPVSGEEDNAAPGPDIDAVERLLGFGSDWISPGTEVAVAGATGDSGNDYRDWTAVEGPSDVRPDGSGDCVLESDGQPRFYSMGAGDDSTPRAGILLSDWWPRLNDGERIRVWEVGPDSCSNFSDDGQDAYEVYLGRSDAEWSSITDPSEIRDDPDRWIYLGASASPNGGVTTFNVDLP